MGSPVRDTEKPRNELGTAKCLEGHLEMEIKKGLMMSPEAFGAEVRGHLKAPGVSLGDA